MNNPWLDAQQKFLENWSSMVQSPFGASGMSNGTPSSTAFWQNPWAYWQDLMQGMSPASASWMSAPWMSAPGGFAPGMSAPWMSSTGSMGEAWTETARSTAERMMMSQAQTMQLLQQVTEAWQTLASSAMNGGDWQEALASYTSTMRQQWQTASEQMLALNASGGELWTAYLQTLQASGQPWLQAWSTSMMQWPAQFGNAVDSAGNGSLSGLPSAATLMAPYWDAMEQTFGQSLSTPPLGLTREFTHLLNMTFQAWLANRRAEFEYQSIINEGWISTFEALMRRLVLETQAGNPVQTPRGMTDLWVEVGDDVFTELFRSERYASAQAAMVNSSMTMKLKQRELLERWLISNDMPTRSEVDEAHRVIHALRKEVKALRKQIAGTAQVAQSAQDEIGDAEYASTQLVESLEEKLAAIEKRQGQMEKDLKKQASATKPKRRTRKATTSNSASSKSATAEDADGNIASGSKENGSNEAGEA